MDKNRYPINVLKLYGGFTFDLNCGIMHVY